MPCSGHVRGAEDISLLLLLLSLRPVSIYPQPYTLQVTEAVSVLTHWLQPVQDGAPQVRCRQVKPKAVCRRWLRVSKASLVPPGGSLESPVLLSSGVLTLACSSGQGLGLLPGGGQVAPASSWRTTVPEPPPGTVRRAHGAAVGTGLGLG